MSGTRSDLSTKEFDQLSGDCLMATPRVEYGYAVPVIVRQPQPGDSREEVLAMGHAAWLSGHGHLFSPDENALVMASNTNDIFQTSWIVPPQGLTWLAVDGPKIVGAVDLRPVLREADYGLVEPMNVLPEYQRQGVGKSLWIVVAAWSKHRGEKGLRVWALNGNDKAMSFYKKIGCRVVDEGELRLGAHAEPATGFQYEF